MRDLVFLAVVGGFFTAMTGFVRLCDRVVGPDPAPAERTAPEPEGVLR